MSAALVIVDVQKAMDDPCFGKRGQPEAEARMAALLAHWRERGNPVVHVQDCDMDPQSPYAPGKPSHAFKPEVAPLDHEPVVEKRTNNAFVGTDLLEVLQHYGSSELVICGVHAQHCVDSTIRMAGNLGFMVFVPADCVIAVEQRDHNGKMRTADEVHALTLALLDGEYAKVLESGDLIALPENETLQ